MNSCTSTMSIVRAIAEVVIEWVSTLPAIKIPFTNIQWKVTNFAVFEVIYVISRFSFRFATTVAEHFNQK